MRKDLRNLWPWHQSARAQTLTQIVLDASFDDYSRLYSDHDDTDDETSEADEKRTNIGTGGFPWGLG